MSKIKRQNLIKEIEGLRGSRVITYITSNRENIDSEIEESDIIKFREHLDAVCPKCKKKLDLFIFSYGGELEAACELVNLLHEYKVDFSVLIPYHARSAATMIAFGAKEVVMGKMGSLGPIDPTIRIKGGELGGMELSTADIDSFDDFLRDQFQLSKTEEKIKAFDLLGANVPPLLIGKAYKNYQETKKDAAKLLQRYITDPAKVKGIVTCFIKDIRTHNHSISRNEAKMSGLNVVHPDARLEKAIWNLYKQYVRAMEMDIPYIDTPPKTGTRRDVPFTYIESMEITSKKIGLLKFNQLDFPKGSKLVEHKGGTAVRTPDGKIINVIPTGRLLGANNLIYDKTEDTYWIYE